MPDCTHNKIFSFNLSFKSCCIPCLDISLVDFTDPYDIGGFISLLCQTGANLGMTVPDFKPTRETIEIRQLANKVARKLDEAMPGMPAVDALMTVQSYDLAYRTAYQAVPEQSWLNKYVLKAFDSMIHGDKSIDEYAMYQAIAHRKYFAKPLIWLTTTEERWYKEANSTSIRTAFPTITS